MFYSTLNYEGWPKLWSCPFELLSHQLFFFNSFIKCIFFFCLFTLCLLLSYSSLALFGRCKFPLHLSGDHIYNLFEALLSWITLPLGPTPTPPLLVHARCLFSSPSSNPLSAHISQYWRRLFSTVSWAAFSLAVTICFPWRLTVDKGAKLCLEAVGVGEEPRSPSDVKLWEPFLCLLPRTLSSLWPAFPFVFCVVSEKPGVFTNVGLLSSQAWVISRGLMQAGCY